MKNVLKLTVVLQILVGSFACEKSQSKEQQYLKNKNENQQDLEEYYVSGYEACSGVSINGANGEAGGYYIVSADLKDTLLTYNFPKNVLTFPVEIFHSTLSTPAWFPASHEKAFKIQLSYRVASEEERIYPICTGMVFIQNVNATQIIINSATKID
ncbi:MAG: hypothetical protein LBQ28_09905 [Prevotellaceae bacterium]|jgi:hypothetical protein|nr:hypothetical protein [Prevotellaceae bacterium]